MKKSDFCLHGPAGCWLFNTVQTKSPPGLANPASINCIQLGGRLDIVKTGGGEVGYCNLRSGERVEEWELYRRNHG
jgi:Putative hemolysin